MLRVRLLAVTMILLAGAALAGCTSSGSLSSSSPPPQQVLPFQSVPAGATVQTAQGQTCSTPCSLALPVTPQVVSFSLSGYVTQTVQMTVHQGEGSLFSSPPPELVPNPVVAQLQALPPAPPPKKVVKPKPRSAAVKPRAAARPASVSGPTQPSIAAPEPAGPQDNVFPPPPPTSTSPFPPPPTR